MVKYLLATNVLIQCLRRNRDMVQGVMAKGKGHDLAISSVTLGELMVGILKNDTPRRRAALRKVLAPIRILPFDEAAATEFARIKLGLEKIGKGMGPTTCKSPATPSAALAVWSPTTATNFPESRLCAGKTGRCRERNTSSGLSKDHGGKGLMNVSSPTQIQVCAALWSVMEKPAFSSDAGRPLPSASSPGLSSLAVP